MWPPSVAGLDSPPAGEIAILPRLGSAGRVATLQAAARGGENVDSTMSGPETFELLDERFARCIKRNARIEKLAEGCRWAEGPVYLPAVRSLVWSDIPGDRML